MQCWCGDESARMSQGIGQESEDRNPFPPASVRRVKRGQMGLLPHPTSVCGTYLFSKGFFPKSAPWKRAQRPPVHVSHSRTHVGPNARKCCRGNPGKQRLWRPGRRLSRDSPTSSSNRATHLSFSRFSRTFATANGYHEGSNNCTGRCNCLLLLLLRDKYYFICY